MIVEPPAMQLPQKGEIAGKAILTRSRLLELFRQAGVLPGGLLCVHSSLRGLGFVIGGARMVLDCLYEAIGPDGTLMMPSFSGDNSDPGEWKYPGVPLEMVDEIRRELPPFDPARTPTWKMGAIAELFRHEKGVQRSGHPQSSFCARGPLAHEICGGHRFDYRFGEESPLGALVRQRGQLLLAGAPWNTVSLFYLTEFAMPDRSVVRRKIPVPVELGVEWMEFEDLAYRNEWHDAVAHLVDTNAATHLRTLTGHLVLFDASVGIEKVTQWRLRQKNFSGKEMQIGRT